MAKKLIKIVVQLTHQEFKSVNFLVSQFKI